MEPQISIAIMSHPQRAAAAEVLSKSLSGARVVVDPSPMGRPTPLKTAIHAWRAVSPGATHHLVVQDDVELSDDFMRRVAAGVRLFPDAVLAFYSNWSSRNGAAIRLASAAGATWTEDTGMEYFPTLAMVMPSAYIDDYLDLAPRYTAVWPDDDDLMREFLESRDIPAYHAAPCLVEHGGLDSIAGNDSHGVRQAACFTREPVYSHEALAHSLDYIPWMTTGRARALVRVVHDGRQHWIRRPWTDMLAPFELDAADLNSAYARLVSASPRLRKADDDLGTLFASSVWLTGFLMGTVTRTIPVRHLAGTARTGDPALTRAGLRTIAAGGIGWTYLPMSLLATYATETSELAEAGFTNGLENR